MWDVAWRRCPRPGVPARQGGAMAKKAVNPVACFFCWAAVSLRWRGNDGHARLGVGGLRGAAGCGGQPRQRILASCLPPGTASPRGWKLELARSGGTKTNKTLTRSRARRRRFSRTKPLLCTCGGGLSTSMNLSGSVFRLVDLLVFLICGAAAGRAARPRLRTFVPRRAHPFVLPWCAAPKLSPPRDGHSDRSPWSGPRPPG